MADYVLVHHGIKGQKWGLRRYQNEDGGLTPSGRRRYSSYLTAKFKAQNGADSKEYKRSSELDSKITGYREKESTGKSFVKTMLLGSSGKTTYDMARSLGYKRGRAFLKSVFDISAGSVASGAVSSISSNASRGALQRGRRGLATAYSLAGGVGARAADYAIDRSGRELSLQQRSMRRKYMQGRYKR